MTQREEQLLRWIRENPMISQQELADKAGITRSSVSVHISNLMKKGYIQGKGYVVNDQPYVAVVGAANIDIGGFSFGPLRPHGAAPGRTRTSLGGVGRNIAHNLTLLGVSARLVTVLGDDVFARNILSAGADIGLDMAASLTVPGTSTGTYLYLYGPGGETRLAISDTDIYTRITPEFLAARIQLLNGAALCVVDANVPAESIEWLAAHCTAPLFADAVDVSKAGNLKNALEALAGLKLTRAEAESLSGITIDGPEALRRAGRALLHNGPERIFISLGARGLYGARRSGEDCLLDCAPAAPVNTTGGGDAVSAALVMALLEDLSLEQSVRAALAAGAIAIESDQTISPSMSRQALEERIAAM